MQEISIDYVSCVLALCTTFGIFGNLNVIVASVRKAELRTTCSILIATTAFFDLIHECSHYIMFYVNFSSFSPTLLQCFQLQFFSMIGCNAGGILLLLTSIDRLYCILRPIDYKNINGALELTVCITIAVSYALWLNYEAYSSLLPIQDQTTICGLPSSFKNRAEQMFSLCTAFINFLTLLIYATIWLYVKKITKQRIPSLLRSIAAVAICGVGGWLLSFTLFVAALASMKIVPEQLVMYLGLPINISITLNYPIYFLMSRQYQRAFQEQLHILTCGVLHRGMRKTAAYSTTIARSRGTSSVAQTNS
ncbi:unnamed protein product [Bursaphelenchus okinawaensis]|uniref:G-protein coupled receptors family 1 profile domain-containing protein n=1 Tax=Bursaphelenchus okinawaensis TaxID=465554 RepID=A0A811L2N5_9BILA|nr:unnamed protein product [Bursaphelenchus okinawaensis]CAG9117611.1 unnamed protein product [Bursaphelenchus okinawaensis]